VGSDQGQGRLVRALTVSAGIIDRNIFARERPVDPGEPSGHPERVCDEIGAEDERQLHNEREDLERDRVHVDRKIGCEESGSTLVGVGEGGCDVQDIHAMRRVLEAIETTRRC
jgi:hypothetical protein